MPKRKLIKAGDAVKEEKTAADESVPMFDALTAAEQAADDEHRPRLGEVGDVPLHDGEWRGEVILDTTADAINEALVKHGQGGSCGSRRF